MAKKGVFNLSSKLEVKTIIEAINYFKNNHDGEFLINGKVYFFIFRNKNYRFKKILTKK